MPRDFDLDFDDDDLMQPRRQAPQRQQRPQPRPQQRPQRDLSNTQGLDRMDRMDRMGGGMPRQGGGRKKKNQTRSIIILVIEIVVFIALLVTFFVLKNKITNGDTSSKSSTEGSSEAGGSSGGVNVESDSFTLTCTKVQLANDANGNPAALIYFTFVNKTDTPLSMNDVFPPSVKQNGMDCATNAVLSEEPAEIANHSAQVSGGQAIDCCYAISLQDFTSTLTLTIHDNYETFSDIGSTDIPLS